MKALLAILAVFVVSSCGHSPLVSHLEGSDSVAIRFKQQSTGLVSKVVGTARPYAIQDLLTYTGSKETTKGNCGEDGDIIFFKKGIPAGHVSFNYTSDGCHHFMLNRNGKIIATEMNNQAVDLFKALANEAP